ncbi:MAG: TolC family outer membrane protein [Burkholderiaceae bacterium]|jgi:outer membrane protein|nr:TolC family outer membrane protein [Burkholderiaceae bacterium]
MRKRFIISLAASFAFVVNAFASDLSQIYQEALVSDPQYASARASLMAGQEQSVQGFSQLLPQIGASGSYNRTKYESVPHSSETRYGVNLTQPLFNWASYQNYERSKLAVSVSEARFAASQQDLIIRVAQAYFDVLTTQDVLVFAQAQKIAIAEQLESAKRSFEVGTTTITDVHEAQARYDLADAQEYAAASDLEIKRAALQQIIGHLPDNLARLRKGVNVSAPEPNKMNAWVNYSEKQNYDVAASELALEMARRDISINRAGHYPTVDLVAGYNHTNNAREFATSDGGRVRSDNSSTVGVQWNIPIFSGYAITSRVRESIALEDKARNDLVASRRSAAQLAREAFLGLNSGLSQIRALEAAEVSSLSALESNKLGYEVGVRINIDVLNAEQQVFSTRRDLTQARHAAIMNALKLKYAAGILNDNDVQEINALLER